MKRIPLTRKTPLTVKKPWQWQKTATVSKQRDPYWKAVSVADTWFSRFIRRKAANKDGVVRCATCGKFDDWKEMDAGHYIARNHMGTRYHEKNVHPQCKACNRFGEGVKDEYAFFLLKTYGPKVLEELNRAKHLPTDMDEYQLKLITEDYKARYKAL